MVRCKCGSESAKDTVVSGRGLEVEGKVSSCKGPTGASRRKAGRSS